MLGESREIEAKPSQERLRKRPNKAKTEDPRQTPRTKKKHKTQRSRNYEHGLARRHHGRGAPFFPRLFRFPLRLFVFLRSFSVCATILALKEGCIWPYWDENS